MAEKWANVDDYISSFPEETQAALQGMRRAIHDAVPGGQEKISYQIPTVTVNGKTVVHFAGWATHVSLYPIPGGDAGFERELAPYRAGRGTLKFPLGQPIPYDLIGRAAAQLAAR